MAKNAAVLRFPAQRRRHREVAIGDKEVKLLKDLVEYEGLAHMAREIGVSQVVLLRVCCGWFDRCNIGTKQKVRAFFGERTDD